MGETCTCGAPFTGPDAVPMVAAGPSCETCESKRWPLVDAQTGKPATAEERRWLLELVPDPRRPELEDGVELWDTAA